MSIKVGYLNEKYTTAHVNKNNVLTLNSFSDSNIIILNDEGNTSDDMYFRYKNRFTTGLSSNTYIFRDLLNNVDLLTLSNSNIIMNKRTIINDDLQVKGLLYTSNNHTVLTNSAVVNFQSNIDYFAVDKLLYINSNAMMQLTANNYSIKHTNNFTIMKIENSNMDVYNNLFIRNGRLFVNEISSISGRLNIADAVYTSTIVDTFKVDKTLTIKNVTGNNDVSCFEIYKQNGNANIMNVYSSNLNILAPYLSLNKDGYLGLGTTTPDSVITITKNANNIIKYNGDVGGDMFIVNKRGNIGVGTNNPTGQVHIKRQDDLQNENIRRLPLLHIDMDYNAINNNCNVTSAAIVTNFTHSADYPNTNTDMKLYRRTIISVGGQSATTVNNTYYMMNSVMYNAINNNINNISTLVFSNPITLELAIPTNNQPQTTPAVTLVNKLIFAAYNNIHVEETTSLRQYQAISQSSPSPEYRVNYYFIMMTLQTKQNGGYHTSNAQNFTGYISQGQHTYSNPLNESEIVYTSPGSGIKFVCTLKFIIEKNVILSDVNSFVNYPLSYQTISSYLVPPPNFLTFSCNNNFIASVSPQGTLSLGTQVPDQYKNYLLYTQGTGYIDRIKTNIIDTDIGNKTISCAQNNLININNISCQSLNVNTFSLANVNGNSIIMTDGIIQNLASSNLVFENAQNSYMYFSNLNVHMKTRFSIGKTNISRILDDSTSCKITVDNEIVPTEIESSALKFFKRSNGLIITNDNVNVNPCITVKTTNVGATPYLNIGNSTDEYFFRLTKQNIGIDTNNEFTTNFQLANNNFIDGNRVTNYNSQKYVPYIMQHIKDYNLLTFGEHDIVCIDCTMISDSSSDDVLKTNYAKKISIGIPYDVLLRNGTAIRDYGKYFNDNIKSNNNYMLNIFGNVKIADIKNNPVITAKSTSVYNSANNGSVYTAINGEPDNTNTLRVYGDVMVDNLNTLPIGYINCSNIVSYNMNTSNIKVQTINVLDDIYMDFGNGPEGIKQYIAKAKALP